MGRVILAAMGSGSGKTIITCGILNALKDMGLKVKSYKCGPDYIDPMFHERVLGIPSDNLDSFFSTKEQLCELLEIGEAFDISIIEGVMGIYDGLGGITDTGSSYDLAKITDTPVILIVNAKGMGRTLISMVKGVLADDKEHRIKGIILNRISDAFYNTISGIMEEETRVPVIGYIKEMKDVLIESRHLGLKLPEEITDLKNQVENIANSLKSTVSLEMILDIARTAPNVNNIKCQADYAYDESIYDKKVRLAVAKDEVFCFYYEQNFRVLEKEGVEIVFFSPLHDINLPKDIDGILLGGGYPELRLKELAGNAGIKIEIKNAIEKGIPSLAECGGFMYLHNAIIDEDDNEFEMVGAIDGKCFNTGKLCRFGYVDLKIGEHNLKGHEFHYYDSTLNGEDNTAIKPLTGKMWKYGYYDKNKIWGFPHLYYGSCEKLIEDFVLEMRNYRKDRYENE